MESREVLMTLPGGIQGAKNGPFRKYKQDKKMLFENTQLSLIYNLTALVLRSRKLTISVTRFRPSARRLFSEAFSVRDNLGATFLRKHCKYSYLLFHISHIGWEGNFWGTVDGTLYFNTGDLLEILHDVSLREDANLQT